MAKRAPVFAREATGLVRSISPWTALWTSVGTIGFGTGLLFLNVDDSYLPNGNPGGNVVVATAICMLVTLFFSYVYYTITRAVGRSGGDYVWLSRNIGPVIASALTFGGVLAGFPYIAISINWMFTVSLIPSIATIGVVTNSMGLLTAVNALRDPTTLTAVSLVILTAITVMVAVSPGKAFQTLAAFSIIATIGTVLIGLIFLVAGPSGIQSSVGNILQQNNSTFTSIATQYTGPPLSLSAILLLFPAVMFTLPFVTNTAVWSGELKNLKKSAVYGTFVAALVSGGLLILFLQMYYSYLGFDFAMQAPNSWPTSLAAVGLTPNMLTIATIASNNSVIMWIMNITFAFWYLAAVEQTILGISRYLLALSFDKLLPSKIAAVSDRYASPIVAVGIVFVVSAVLVILVSFTSWLSLFSTQAALLIFFAFTGVAAIVYSWKHKDTLSGGSRWLLIVSSIVTVIFFLYVAYQDLALPYYGINNFSWALMGALWILGAAAYPISKIYWKRKSIDLSMVFKELPPE